MMTAWRAGRIRTRVGGVEPRDHRPGSYRRHPARELERPAETGRRPALDDNRHAVDLDGRGGRRGAVPAAAGGAQLALAGGRRHPAHRLQRLPGPRAQPGGPRRDLSDLARRLAGDGQRRGGGGGGRLPVAAPGDRHRRGLGRDHQPAPGRRQAPAAARHTGRPGHGRLHRLLHHRRRHGRAPVGRGRLLHRLAVGSGRRLHRRLVPAGPQAGEP